MSVQALGRAKSGLLHAYLPLVLLLFVGGLLGLFSTLVKAAVQTGWNPIVYLFWGLLGAGLILFMLAVVAGHKPRRDPGAVLYYAGSGLLSGALPNALSFAAVPHVGASFVALCFAFPPLLSYAMALALRMERYRALRMAGLLLGLAGVLALVAEKFSIEGDSLGWLLIALSAPVVVASGNIFRSRYWPVGATALSLAPGMLLAGAAMLALFIIVNDLPLLPDLNPERLLLIASLIVVFAATFSLIFVLQALAGPVYLSQIGSVGAVAGAALAIALFDEPFSPILVVSTAVILVGAWAVNRTR